MTQIPNQCADIVRHIRENVPRLPYGSDLFMAYNLGRINEYVRQNFQETDPNGFFDFTYKFLIKLAYTNPQQAIDLIWGDEG